MNSKESAYYRLRLADGFLQEAAQDRELGRWRSCLDSSRRVVENSIKAINAMIEPVDKSHNHIVQLRRLVDESRISEPIKKTIQENLSRLESLGSREYMLSGYGDDEQLKAPWDIITPEEAGKALTDARSSFEFRGASSRNSTVWIFHKDSHWTGEGKLKIVNRKS